MNRILTCSKVLQARLKAFQSNGVLQKKAAGMGIRGKLHRQLSSDFVTDALAGNVKGCDAKAVLEGYNPYEGIGKYHTYARWIHH